MNRSEGERLAEFSRAVRESTLKRLLQVPLGRENWSPTSAVMTFADIAHHIGEADRWLFQKLDDPRLLKMVGKTEEAAHVSSEEFQKTEVICKVSTRCVTDISLISRPSLPDGTIMEVTTGLRQIAA
jgi:hypothetical protein